MPGRLPEPAAFTAGDGLAIRGETAGSGPALVLCHGITATRRYVVHGSRLLERAGRLLISYDARGHGESDPAPPVAAIAIPSSSAIWSRSSMRRWGRGGW